MKIKNYAIILASGSSQRMQSLNLPKQFLKIAGKTIIEHSLEVFEKNNLINEIIIVTRSDYIDFCKKLIKENNYKKITNILSGGATRYESSAIAINNINAQENDNILIHDAVRPFVTDKIIEDCIKALLQYNAVNVAIDTVDTMIEIDSEGFIKNIPQRESLKRVQTPQAFKYKIIKQAHNLTSKTENLEVTDDCSLVRMFNLAKVFIVKGDETNIKITYPIDIEIAEKIFKYRTETKL